MGEEVKEGEGVQVQPEEENGRLEEESGIVDNTINIESLRLGHEYSGAIKSLQTRVFVPFLLLFLGGNL